MRRLLGLRVVLAALIWQTVWSGLPLTLALPPALALAAPGSEHAAVLPAERPPGPITLAANATPAASGSAGPLDAATRQPTATRSGGTTKTSTVQHCMPAKERGATPATPRGVTCLTSSVPASGSANRAPAAPRSNAVQPAGAAVPKRTAGLAGQSVTPGTAWGWGYNFDWELGTASAGDCDSGLACSLTAIPIPGFSNVTALSGGDYHSMALTSGGSVWGWGYNDQGEVGNGTVGGGSCTCVQTPMQVVGPGGTGTLGGVTAIAGGGEFSLALRSDGTVWSWGGNGNGALGDGDSAHASKSSPVQVLDHTGAPLGNVVAIDAGMNNGIALKADGTVWAWGDNQRGELATRTADTCLGKGNACSLTAVQIAGLPSGISAAAVGLNYALALASDGTIWAWGDDGYGQLGATAADSCGTSDPCSFIPLHLTNLSGVQAISGGFNFSTALKSDGTVWAWGQDNEGQLGNGTTNITPNPTPAQVGGLPTISAIASRSGDHTLALTGDGAVWSWGDDFLAALGDGTTGGGSCACRTTPVAVQGPSGALTGALAIDVGYDHSLAILNVSIPTPTPTAAPTSTPTVAATATPTATSSAAPPAQPAPAAAAFYPPAITTTTGGDPVNTLTGSYTYSHTDLAIAGRGPSPVLLRSYNSTETRTSALGPGWTDNYAMHLATPGDSTQDLLLVGPQGRTDRYTFATGVYTPPSGVYTQLVRNGDGTYTATQEDQSNWIFDSTGRLIRIADRYGNASTLTYNGQGQLTAVSDPAGRGSLSFAYYSGQFNNQLHTITDWANRVVTYTYDASNRLQQVTDRTGSATSYGYDGTSSRLASITDANSHAAITLSYDSNGRVQTQQDALNNQTSFGYATTNTSGPQTTTVTLPATSFDGFHPTTVDTYNSLGQLSQRQTTPSKSDGTYSESYSYDSNDNLIAATDPRGAVTSYCYDVSYNGQATGVVRGNLTRQIAPPPIGGQNPLVTLYQYDTTSGAGTSSNVNNLVETVPPTGVAGGATVTCSTNLAGSVNTLYATDSAYDASKVFLQTVTQRYTDPDRGVQTATTQYQYSDSANPGRVTALLPPLGSGHTTHFSYNASGSQAGLLQSTTDGDGNQTTDQYDNVGRQVSMVDANGNAAGGVPSQHTWNWSYDQEDRLLTASAPAPTTGGSALTTQHQYDAVGNRTVLIDPSGQVTTSRYDARDSLVETDQSPLAWTVPNQPPSTVYATTAGYDHLGNLTRVTRAKGDPANERATDYTYDGLNRLRQETQYPAWPATSPTLLTTYRYDGDGNQVSRIDPLNQTTTSGYDARNRLTSVSYSDGKTPNVTYGYDANANRRSMTVGSALTTYGVDELDRLTSVTTTGSVVVGYRYDLDGNRTKTIYPDGTAVTAAYDSADRQTALTDWASRSTRYGSFPDGSLQTVTNSNGVVTSYSEDHAQRLIQVSNTLGTTILSQQSATLDPLGNRTQATELLPQLITVGGLAPSKAPSGGTTPPSASTPSVRPSPLVAVGPALPSLPRTGVRPLPPAPHPLLALPLPPAPAGSGKTSQTLSPALPTSANPGVPWLWGDDDAGQLGDGSTTNRSSPQAVLGQTSGTAAVGGGAFSLVLHPDGTVWAMGDNSLGELGTGSTTSSTTPVQVSGLTSVTAIAAGVLHGVALKQDGTVWTWGDNTYGELGNGSTTNSSSPVQVTGLSGVTAVASTGYHTLAVKSDGTVWAWGLNASGQLGQGTISSTGCSCSDLPLPVPGIAGATAIAAGAAHSAALVGSGVWTWGDNAEGELGQGTTSGTGCQCVPTPGQVTGAGGVGLLSGVTTLKTGSLHSLAVKSDGTLWGWGANGSGQLGDGSTANRPSPVQVSGLLAVTSVAGGLAHSLAGTSDGRVWSWGDNTYGELGEGDRTSHLVPVVVPALTGPTVLAGGGAQSLAVGSTGQLLSWGDDYFGQLGDGSTTNRSSPQQVGSRAGVVHLAGGNLFSATVGSDGTVWMAGDNSAGELGDGTTTQRSSAVQVAGLGAVQQVATGGGHTLAVRQDGTVWAWGANPYGELGDGTTTNRSSPVQVPGLTGMVAVAAGYADSYALKQDGSVWSWGDNGDGELGTGTTTTTGCSCSVSPVQVVGPGGTGALGGVASLAAGGFVGLALRTDGTLWSWGDNGTGALGDGTTVNRTSPVQVSGLSAVTSVAGGFLFGLAVKQDGSVWGWGDNSQGQLGDGTTTTRLTPVAAAGITGAVAVAAGADHSLVLTGTGTLWAMGSNSFGQLGTGTRSQSSTPVAVVNLGGMATLGAGDSHSLAVALRSRSTSYAYDHLSQLTGVRGPGQLPASYGYDPVGNRSSAQQGSVATAFGQDKADRLTGVGGLTASSDADGNLTALSGPGVTDADSASYDQANRLVSATVNGSTTTYAYDGDGLRISQTVNGATTAYVNDVNRSLPVLLTEGTTKEVWGPGGLAERVDAGGNVQVPLTDGLGSVRAITDGVGNVLQTALTDAFGTPAFLPGAQSALQQPFGFTGQPQDGDSLVYLRGRYYAPSLGRFLSRDTVAGALTDPLSLNRSTYAHNNPTTLTDPSGMTPGNKILQDSSTKTCADPSSPWYCPVINPILNPGGFFTMLPGLYHGQGEGGGGGSGLRNLPRLRNSDLAERVVIATGGTVKLASNGQGYVINVAFKKGRDIVVRVMDEGGPRTDYYRVGVEGKASYSVAGEKSAAIDLTHIPIGTTSIDDILRIVNGIRSGAYGS